MPQTIQTTDLRRRSREILDRVRKKKEAVIIQSYTSPQAVIVPYEEYNAFLAWQTQNEKHAMWLAELRRIADEVSQRAALTDEEADALIEEAIQTERNN